LAQIYWLQGYADRAREAVKRAIEEAEIVDSRSLTTCGALLWSLPVFVWVGDLRSAVETVELATRITERDPILRLGIQAEVWRAKLSILMGEIDCGILALRSLSEAADPDQSLKRSYVSSLAAGLASQGQIDEALAILDTVIAEIELHGGSMYLPEILRTKGEILASTDGGGVLEAERCFQQSVECARNQSAFAFELQAAISLAALWRREGREEGARKLLEPIYLRFTEGFDTVDLRTAKEMLDQMK
jgi:hypothetical protein